MDGPHGKHMAHIPCTRAGLPATPEPADLAQQRGWRRTCLQLREPGRRGSRRASSFSSVALALRSRTRGSTTAQSQDGALQVSEQSGFWAPPGPGEWPPSRQRRRKVGRLSQLISRQLPGAGGAGAEAQDHPSSWKQDLKPRLFSYSRYAGSF